MVCDWNWPVVGAAWLDSLFLLIGPRGDGLDVEAVLAARPLLRDVPAEHIDVVLALLTGYFFRQRDEPVPPTSPYLREHQRGRVRSAGPGCASGAAGLSSGSSVNLGPSGARC